MKDEVNKRYSLYDTIKALARYVHFTYVKSELFTPSASQKAKHTREARYTREAGFENMICEYIDAVNIIRKIKNINKRAILLYTAMGYCNWEIAIDLGISEQAISKNIKWIGKFIKEIQEQ